MDKLTSIRAFTKVVQHGSFSAAARELRLSRSAVSKYVIDLEQDLGVQLLVRTTRSASPTENGQAYYERCIAILADLEEADLAVTRLQAEPRGLLRVNAPMSFGTLHLGRAVADFMGRYPELQIQLVLSDEQIDPVAGRLRRHGAHRRPAVIEPHRAQDRARAPHDLRGADLSRAGTARRNIPTSCASTTASPTAISRPATSGSSPGPTASIWIQIPWTLCSNNGEALRDAAVKGHGIALLPTFIVGADLQAGHAAQHPDRLAGAGDLALRDLSDRRGTCR